MTNQTEDDSWLECETLSEAFDRARNRIWSDGHDILGEGGARGLLTNCHVLKNMGLGEEIACAAMHERWPEYDHVRLRIRIAKAYLEISGVPDDNAPFVIASKITMRNVVWLWPNRIAIGKINFIAGYPDMGKSQLTCDIAARVTKGDPWPNKEGRAEKGSVVMLSAEDDPADTIIPRLRAAGADLDKVAIAKVTVVDDEKGHRTLNIATDLKVLTEIVERQGDLKLVIIDPISAYMGGKATADTYKNTEVRAVLAPLAEWAAKHELAVLFVSHFNKNGSGRALSRLTDSLAFGALARCGWFAVGEENAMGPTGRKLFLKGKNNLAKDAGGLAYTIDERTVKHKGLTIEAPHIAWQGPVSITVDQALNAAGAKASAIDLAETFLEDALASGPKSSHALKEQAEARGFSWATVRRAKVNLDINSERKGFGPGSESNWSLPDADVDEFG